MPQGRSGRVRNISPRTGISIPGPSTVARRYAGLKEGYSYTCTPLLSVRGLLEGESYLIYTPTGFEDCFVPITASRSTEALSLSRYVPADVHFPYHVAAWLRDVIN